MELEKVKVEGRLLTKEQAAKYFELKEKAEYWNRIQHVRKIFLNSSYGALLNKGFRFFDTRMGQSVTLSGRTVTDHMSRKASELVDGTYDKGPSIITGDTDSVYITLESLIEEGMDQNQIVELSDIIGEAINDSFPDRMTELFFVSKENGAVIKSAREVVARKGLFKNAKKRYALHVIWKDKFPTDKIKIVGMESKRTDTPKFIQTFLEECIGKVLKDEVGEEELREHIDKFRTEVFRAKEDWELGTPCRVSSLAEGSALRLQYEKGKIANPRLHWSIVAADNTNRYISAMSENRLEKIRNGDKIEILHLKQDPELNPLQFNTVALPVGAPYIPAWFRDFPLDSKAAEDRILDKKLQNIFGDLGWDLTARNTAAGDVFSF